MGEICPTFGGPGFDAQHQKREEEKKKEEEKENKKKRGMERVWETERETKRHRTILRTRC